MRPLLLTFLLTPLLHSQGAGPVQFRDWSTPPTSTFTPTQPCQQLRALTTADLNIVSATIIPASAAAPEHCRIHAFYQQDLNIEVNLPTAWNTRIHMFGNGGWAGESFESPGRVHNRAAGLKAGFLTAATDTGHSAASEPGASFAANKQKLYDYGFRSLHLTAETASPAPLPERAVARTTN